MLSSVANYLFGASTVEEAETENGDALSKTQNLVSGETKTDNECDLLTSPADLDWELVDRVGGHVPDKVKKCSNNKCSCANSSPCSSECKKLTPCCSANRAQHESSSRVPPAQFDTFSCNSNTPSEVGSSDSEGWLVTPPPCFTAGGSTEDMEVSPLENLLIEHPSMSVYHKKSSKNSPEETDSSTKERPSSARSKAKQNKKQGTVQQSKPPCRPKAVAERAGILVQLQSNKTSQRQKQKAAAKKNTKKAIARQNRAKEFKSEGRHRNCTDRKMNRSGRMSIRAC